MDTFEVSALKLRNVSIPIMTYIFQAKYIMTLQKVVTCNIYSAVFRIHAACFLTLPVITAKYIFFLLHIY